MEDEPQLSDQEKREVIPTRESLPSMFHPCHNLLMCIPVPGITKIGTIILPDTATITLNEGHVVEKGPLCSEHIGIGDCVTWDVQSEYRLEVDGVKFILVKENCITMVIPRAELEAAAAKKQ